MKTTTSNDADTERNESDLGRATTGENGTAPGRDTVTADLERPIPLLGRRAQHLGDVRRLTLSLGDRAIRQVELTTPWQTLQLNGAKIAFDRRRGVFRLRRRDRSGSSRSPAQPSS